MLNDDMLWKAVLTRDPNWEAGFVYGVTSTGIFCRPTCPSRRPRRDRVRFYSSATAARADGFRACHRCHPDATPDTSGAIERVRRACDVLARARNEVPSLRELSRLVGGSPYHLQRTFTRLLGVSPREYADACRVGLLKTNLRSGEGVAAATYASGYGSGSRVYERAASALGMTPAAYARGGAGHDVRYFITRCTLGRVLVAATSNGICSVKLGSSDEELIEELRREYPEAVLASAGAPLERWVQHILAGLETGSPDPRLPIDVRATAFQRRVWRELQKIPRGETRTYREVATRLGAPLAARAVARACAANPVAIVVPCHRVIPRSGGTGGYRWGAARKRQLLEAERNR